MNTNLNTVFVLKSYNKNRLTKVVFFYHCAFKINIVNYLFNKVPEVTLKMIILIWNILIV